MNIYIIRHGKTEWNEVGIVQGRSNNPLSNFGISQVKYAAKTLDGTNFDVIFCSPLQRTQQTAQIIQNTCHCPIKQNNLLTEIDQGIFTGKYKKDFNRQENKQRMERSHKSMEQFSQVYDRAKQFLDFLKTQTYNTVLIVTHEIVAIMLENIITGKTFDELNNIFDNTFDNAQIKQFVL
jgi:probable phosphoglycerate mutase